MVTPAENELFTRIGPGTRMGALLRRYWHPIAGLTEMEDRWTKRVRLLGEDLVLFKDRRGRFALVAESCPHRRASLLYGIPTDDGIRCPYHGWEFAASGACIGQPNEPEESSFKDKVRTVAYPIEELGGLLWAYLGPLPAPLIPRIDGFLDTRTIRHIGYTVVNCNWLQIMENSIDPVHTEWLHGKTYEFLKEKAGETVPMSKHTVKVAFDEVDYGIVKRRYLEGQPEDASDWTTGHPMIFPLSLYVGSNGGAWKQYFIQVRVPIDDTHTGYYWYNAYFPPAGVEVPAHLFERIPTYEVPVRDENGEYLLSYFHAQDIMTWETQGAIADRSKEALGSMDRGITLYRRMLLRELAKVEAGEDPIVVYRDPLTHRILEPVQEEAREHFTIGFERFSRMHVSNFSPVRDDIFAVFRAAPAASTA